MKEEPSDVRIPWKFNLRQTIIVILVVLLSKANACLVSVYLAGITSLWADKLAQVTE